VFRLNSSQIFTSDSHWETRIVSEFTHQGTIIYDFPVYQVIPKRLGDREVKEGSGGVSSSGGKYKHQHQLELTNNNDDGVNGKQQWNNTESGGKQQRSNKRKRFMQQTSTILSSLDKNSQHLFDDSVIQSIDRSRLLSRTKTVDSAGYIIMHIGRDRNIHSLEFQFTSSSVHEGWESIWY
jgi:hypothetical protein